MIRRVLVRILVPAVVAGAVVYVLTGFMPKTYASYQTLYFPLNPAGGIGALGPIAGAPSGGDAGAVSGLGGAIMYPLIGSGSQTAAGIISSHACQEDVVQRLDLANRWHTTPLNATKKLSAAVTADTDKTGLLLIHVTAESPDLCVAINNAVYNYLKHRTSELSENASISNRKLIEQRLTVAQQDLDNAQSRVVNVMQNTPLSEVGEVQRRYLEAEKALADAKASRDKEQASLTRMESEYHRMAQNGNDGGTITALTTLNPSFASLAQELQKRRLDLDDAMIAFSASSPRVYQAKAAYENARKASDQVRADLKNNAGVTSPEIIRARAELAALDASVHANEVALQSSAKAMSTSPKQYADSTLARDNFESSLSRVNMLKQELERATIMETRDPSRFEVIDQPYEDPAPTGPRRLLFTAVAFFAIAALAAIPFLVGIIRAAEATGLPDDQGPIA